MHGDWAGSLSWRIGAGAALGLAVVVGCAGAMPHDFSSADARDYGVLPGNQQGELERAPVLLVPRNVQLMAARKGPGGVYICASCDGGGAVGGWREGYRGPARVFLLPGAHHYVLSVKTAGGMVDLDLDLKVAPGERFQLEINESDDKVEVSVNALSEEAYGVLYPRGATATYSRR